jgi:acetoacetyl-CoA synthetase
MHGQEPCARPGPQHEVHGTRYAALPVTAPLWTPSPGRVARSNLTRFTARYRPGADYAQLWRWSVERPAEFWPAVWEFCGVIAEPRAGGPPWEAVLEGGDRMAPPDPVLGPRWFRGARLNFAENLLRFDDARDALVFWNEEGRQRACSFAELRRAVDRYAVALRLSGVGVGDRVAGWLPNLPETVIAMLATASLGAIWSSCSPDFGDRAVLDRFGQIRPKLLFAADEHRYAGRVIDLTDRLRALVAGLPAVESVVVVPYLGGSTARRPEEIDRGVTLHQWLAGGEPARNRAIEPALRLPFDHPLYIMYSSGTTGLPKCIVHGAGGTLLQHCKELVLHTDATRDDRIFYYTTCGWMMWNWLVSSLAVGATVVLYDGAPLAPDKSILWKLAESERITIFGTSAKYLALCEKGGLAPGRERDLSALRAILSTGSPLAGHSYEYVYGKIGPDLQLASISGGTDIISCFALGNPNGPVWKGELQCRGLGMAVDVFDAQGRSLTGMPGELVCTRPFPSMPVAFWDDPQESKYQAAYFEHFPNVWRHGDWAERTEHDGLIIHGRSDATLNPGGIRIGTAEIYRQIEQLPEVVESLVVAQDWEDDVRIVLFLRLRPGLTLDEELRRRIRTQIRARASRHHVPKKILQVADLPRTINGKLSELAVRAVVHRRPVTNVAALANPESLELFRDLAELDS